MISEFDRDEWNSFVSSAGGPAILQSFEWGDLKALQGWEPIRIAVRREGRIVAAVQLLERKLPYVPFNLFYAPRGPVLDYNDTDALDPLLEEVKAEAARRRAVALKIDPQVEESRGEVVRSLNDRGFRYCRKNIQPRSTFIIDLAPDLDNLLLSFEEKTRYNIRLSAKKGVSVRRISDHEGARIFYDMYRETAKRDNFLIHPPSYYLNIAELLVKRGMSDIFIAYKGSEPIAGVWTFNFGTRLWYMYGASLNSHRNIMPNHALHWHVIQRAKEKGLKDYDLFGIPSTPDPTHPLWGVYRFKKGFNGRLVKYIGVYDLPYRPLLHYGLDKGIGLYANIRSLLLKGRISDSLSE